MATIRKRHSRYQAQVRVRLVSHVHHRDGNRGNIKPSNLEVLCIACHKARPHHVNLSYFSKNKMRLQNLRISQKNPKTALNVKFDVVF